VGLNFNNNNNNTTERNTHTMFICITTKPLNDKTKGFRFNFLGKKGLYRRRSTIKRRFNVSKGSVMTGYHLGLRSLYIEHKHSKPKQLHHFAG
jgi:hypothetical protein